MSCRASSASSALGGAAPAPRGGAAADALSALANLGFKPADASAAVNAAQDELGARRDARRARSAGAEEGGEMTRRTAPRAAVASCVHLPSGDPVRVSVCHCLACQKRTGSAFCDAGAVAR